MSKIRLVHILTETDTPREQASIASLSPLSNMGLEYVQQVNQRYSGEDWKLSKALTQSEYTNHGPGHYGAFQSFKKAIKENLIVKISQDYRVYHDLLSHILNISHETKPVHSVEEVELLSSRFPDNIKLICCYRNNQIVSGVLLFIEKNIIHTQYIATSNEGKDFGAFEAIVNFLLNEFRDKKYLSFGISTENNGTHLNEGLAQQKESFGARGVCHDFYNINFSL